jgi:hypothetical protein
MISQDGNNSHGLLATTARKAMGHPWESRAKDKSRFSADPLRTPTSGQLRSKGSHFLTPLQYKVLCV